MKNIFNFILTRARERSTWLGLISIATALGLVLSPAQSEAVIAAGMSLAGLIGTLTSDKP